MKTLNDYIDRIVENLSIKFKVVNLSEGVDALVPNTYNSNIDKEFVYGALTAKDIEIVE